MVDRRTRMGPFFRSLFSLSEYLHPKKRLKKRSKKTNKSFRHLKKKVLKIDLHEHKIFTLYLYITRKNKHNYTFIKKKRRKSERMGYITKQKESRDP